MNRFHSGDVNAYNQLVQRAGLVGRKCLLNPFAEEKGKKIIKTVSCSVARSVTSRVRFDRPSGKIRKPALWSPGGDPGLTRERERAEPS